jgi:hypothetical protein
MSEKFFNTVASMAGIQTRYSSIHRMQRYFLVWSSIRRMPQFFLLGLFAFALSRRKKTACGRFAWPSC